MSRCEHKYKRKHYRFGITQKIQCKKESTNQDEHGRLLCKKHFNRWFEKKYGEKYDTFMANGI